MLTDNLHIETNVLKRRRWLAAKPSCELGEGSCVSKLMALTNQFSKFRQNRELGLDTLERLSKLLNLRNLYVTEHCSSSPQVIDFFRQETHHPASGGIDGDGV